MNKKEFKKLRKPEIILVVILLALVAAATIKADEPAPISADKPVFSQGLGVRAWYAEWSDSEGNFGHDPLYCLYYDLSFQKWLFSAMGGYAKGWDLNAKRSDIQAGIGRQIGPVVLGLAYHYINIDVSDKDLSYYFHGPECVLGVGIPIFETGLKIAASVTGLPYVPVRYSAEGKHEGSATTWGYTYDVGPRYAFKMARLSAGYRSQNIEKDDFSDGGKFGGDQFRGFYGELGLSW